MQDHTFMVSLDQKSLKALKIATTQEASFLALCVKRNISSFFHEKFT